MKRVIALLIALACLFSLCTVSAFAEAEINLNDMEDEALVEVYRNAYSILVQRGVIEKRRTIGIEGGAFSFPPDFSYEEMESLEFLLSVMLKENGRDRKEQAKKVPSELPDEPTKDLISVEALSIGGYDSYEIGNVTVQMVHPFIGDITIRNLSGITVPCFVCHFVLMDKNGNVIDTTGYMVTDRIMIADGQSFTEKALSLQHNLDITKVAMVKFTSYTLRDVLDGEFSWTKDYAFIDPPVFVRNPDGTFSKL